MQIAYLKRVPTPVVHNRETFALIKDIENANETAMMKARTLLAFLWDNDLLQRKELGTGENDWILYSLNTVPSFVTENLHTLDDEVCVVVPVNFMEPSKRQPGILLIRDNLELFSILNNSFLDSSRKWLKQHPRELEILVEAFKTNIAQ